jgi:hypothetical protein
MNDVYPVQANPWPRRFAIAGVVLLLWVVGIGAWAYWQWRHNGSELSELLAVLDEIDPGWRLEDLDKSRAVVPAAENAATVIVAAHRLMPANAPGQQVMELFDDLPPPARLNDVQTAALRGLLGTTGPALAEARKLSDLPRGRFPIAYAAGNLPTVLTSQYARGIGSLLYFAALARAQEGDSAGALADCRAVFHTSTAVGDEPTTNSMFVRISRRALAVTLLERLLAQGDPPADALADLQRRLEADEPANLLLVMARGERGAFYRDMQAMSASQTLRTRLGEVILAENPVHDRAIRMNLLSRHVESARGSDTQRMERLQRLRSMVDDDHLPPPVNLLLPAMEKARLATLRSHAQLRCAIAALAAERYRRQAGRWPDSLDALVTVGLLKAVPADPFADGPLKLKKLPDGLMIYSVGVDRSDDGGMIDRKDPTRKGADLGFQLWEVAKRRGPPLPPKKADEGDGPASPP